jgi:hypothetical protein
VGGKGEGGVAWIRICILNPDQEGLERTKIKEKKKHSQKIDNYAEKLFKAI